MTDEGLIESALAAIKEVKGLSVSEVAKKYPDFGIFPPMFPVSNNRFANIAPYGLEALQKFGANWREQNPDIRQQVDKEGAQKLAIDSFGPALMDDRVVEPLDLRILKTVIKEVMSKSLVRTTKTVEHYFPCHLLLHPTIGQFEMGPVTFRRTSEWLEYIKGKSTKSFGTISSLEELYKNKRAVSDSANHYEKSAESVKRNIDDCPWIASVIVKDNQLSRSRERAKASISLALSSIGLLFSQGLSRNFRGPNEEIRSNLSVTLCQFEDTDLLPGFVSDAPLMHTIPADASADFLRESLKFIHITGSFLTSVVDNKPVAMNGCPGLIENWCEALTWFAASRRDSLNFMALVHIGMSLDILTHGRKKKGIQQLLSTIFNIKEHDKFITDGTTLSAVVARIYDYGRSQLGHGTRKSYFEDLPFDHFLADSICATVLRRYAIYLSHYRGADGYECFLNEIPKLDSKISPDEII